ncbi:MAG: alkaline phosphatase D family protein [Pseudomonadota bacterium]
MTDEQALIGPVLLLDDLTPAVAELALLVLARGDAVPPPAALDGASVAFDLVATFDRVSVWRAPLRVALPRRFSYHWNGVDYPVALDLSGDCRLAYVSCNGEEHGDLDRDADERNVMWKRLAAEHDAAPFALLLHGGDQIYADEVKDGHPLTRDWPVSVPEKPDPAALDGFRAHLRAGFGARYAALYAMPGFATLAARVPSLMQWDDHDICDGWGSLAASITQSAVGQTLYEVAHAATLAFQHGATPKTMPARFGDAAGRHLGWQVKAPGFRILAPDLRGERQLDRVMGPAGWAFTREAALPAEPGHSFLMSSVPLLGPRLSLIERAMRWLPGIQKYEDDLRDQWQSYAHRAAWIEMLDLVRAMTDDPAARVTALSGEIHLATRAEMRFESGKVLHQLVASAITHRPPPRAWARALGALAALGEDPIPRAPIRIHPLPGRRQRYQAERNALVLTRTADAWSAVWLLEQSGTTPPLAL